MTPFDFFITNILISILKNYTYRPPKELDEIRLTDCYCPQRYVVSEAGAGGRGGVRAGRPLLAADVRHASVVLDETGHDNLFITERTLSRFRLCAACKYSVKCKVTPV